MSYEDDYDYDDEPATPTVAVEASLTLTAPALDLNAKVGRQTVADLVVAEALRKLAKGEQWPYLSDRVRTITDEEIRNHVAELLKDALDSAMRRTNSYGEPQGEPTTLRTMIAEEAKRALTRAAGDGYRNSGETVIGKLIREQVTDAMKKELAEVIAEERKKVVAAVREQAAQLIAEAVTKGVGGK